MTATKAPRDAKYVKPSKRQARRKRRLRFAKLADGARREELIRGTGPTIETTADYHIAAACGWDPFTRGMRLREPPTRARPCPVDGKLNRRNAWHQPGDAKKLVRPIESAAWLWWLTLGDETQDELYELSMKACGEGGDGGTAETIDPLTLLGGKNLFREGEDVGDQGRL